MYLLSIIRCSLTALLVIAGVVVPQVTSAHAQNAIVVVLNLDEVKEAVNRLQNECGKVGEAAANCQQLLDEGKAILEKNLLEHYAPFMQRAEFFLGFVVDAPIVKAAMSERKKPPFDPLWRVHHLSRNVAKGLALDENRCAIRLSMTLGLSPIPAKGDESLENIGTGLRRQIYKQLRKWGRELWKGKELEMYIPVREEVKDADLGGQFYIKSAQLANRLRDEWGAPHYAQGEEAVKKLLLDKRGVVFFEGGFGWRGNSNHIDLWNGRQWASYDPQEGGTDFKLASERAVSVWFWEITEPKVMPPTPPRNLRVVP